MRRRWCRDAWSSPTDNAPMNDISYFRETNHRRKFVPFGIRQIDRLMHMYVIGQTGVGKSTLIETLARGDLYGGRGFALLDPHGDLAEQMRDAAERSGRSYFYVDASASNQPYGFNPLRRTREDKIPLAVNDLMDAMHKLWGDAWGVRVLRNSLYALIERDGSTLPDILRMFADKAFRKGVVATIRNRVVKAYWRDEFEKYPDRQRAEVVAPVQNKLGGLLIDPHLYRMLVLPQIPISIRKLMDQGGILIVNLAKGALGAESADVLGSMIVATSGIAAMCRADTAIENGRPFFLYADEFQNFTTLSFATMLPELRKMGVGLVLAHQHQHQHLHQLHADVLHAVLGNAGTLIAFRVGSEDAALIARQLQPTFEILDILNLPNRRFYTRMMIDGVPSRPFSADLPCTT